MPNGDGASRRSFLKLGGAAALLSTLDGRADAADKPLPAVNSQTSSGASPADGAALVNWVNPLQGTDSTPLFSRGNTLPIIAVPFAFPSVE